MTKKPLIAALIAAATLAPTAHAHGGGRGWDDDRHWKQERHHRHEWRHHHHDHWHHGRHRAPPPPAWGYAPAWRPAPPVVYDYRPVISVPVPLPPTPWEVHRAVRDSLFGRW